MTIKVEVFASPGCGQCGRVSDLLRHLAREMSADRIDWREVNVVEEFDYAVELGVLATPAIAIDGRLRFTGLPSINALRTEFERCLTAEPGANSA